MNVRRPKVAVVTTSRADYGIYLPVLRELAADAEIELGLFVSGQHLMRDRGYTVVEIEADGFSILERLAVPLAGDGPWDVAQAMGDTTRAFGAAFHRHQPDLLIVLGDRYEMFAAVSASVPFRIPLAHIHGGEETEGALDNVFRHAISKMSHLHLCATKLSAKRLASMGEPAGRIVVVGAPGLDNLRELRLLDRTEFVAKFSIPEAGDFLLVTYHPVTREYEKTSQQIAELLAALDHAGQFILFTGANADMGAKQINRAIAEFCLRRPERSRLFESLGQIGYLSALAHASVVVGNSSSGIIEAASFGVPVVNIGTRQAGRERSENIIDCGYGRQEIEAALARARSAQFCEKAKAATNIYGDGHAAPRIAAAIKRHVQLGAGLLQKATAPVGPEFVA
jgi:UDP-hydrolysing UDP-N-acetyl-D-glucosamine 2-epimerase